MSAALGNNCPAGSADSRCTPVTTVLTPGLSIIQTADTTSAVPGQQIGYTLTITNTGQTTYTGAVVTDSFAQMVDDAAYDGDAATTGTAGTLSYAAPVLTWTGDLAPGASAVITFSVTVNNPDTGDKLVITTAASAVPGSSCPPGTTTSPCQLVVPVLTPALTITAAAAPATAAPGGTVTYTLTVTDTGQTSYTGATVTDPLAGVLDDAAYTGGATATIGSVTLHRPGADLDREPGPRRHRHHRLLGDRQQPRHRQPHPGQHPHLRRVREQLPGRGHRPPLHHHGAGLSPDDRDDRQRPDHGARWCGGLHHHDHQCWADSYYGISSDGRGHPGNDVTSDGDVTASSGTLSIGADRHGLDRRHPDRRHRHHHLLVHGRQPRHRRHLLIATAISAAPGTTARPAAPTPAAPPVIQVLTPGLTHQPRLPAPLPRCRASW